MTLDVSKSREGILSRLGLGTPAARAWATYDWANSAMVTVVITAIFPIYFKNVAAEGMESDLAIVRLARATTIALIAVALVAPVLGAIADVKAQRKRFLVGFAGLGVLATAGLFTVQSGDWMQALVFFALANIGAAGSVVFYDALLPHVSPPGGEDKLSTAGYALGYVGGGLVLAACLVWIQNPGWIGLPSGEGLSSAQATLPTRIAFLVTAIWWGLFTLPLLFRVPEPAAQMEADESLGQAPLRTSFRRLGETFSELRHYRHAFWMLLAFLLYNDGIQTIIRMAAIYASAQDLDQDLIIKTILAIQFVGVPFAFLFGSLAGRFGPKSMIFVGLIVYCGISILAYFMTANWHFVALGALVGMVQGGTQGLSRSLFATMTPQHKSGEFFAFFAVGEKFAGILGPLMFAAVIEFTGSSQNAILSVILFFIVGGALLTKVDVEAGRAAAREADEDLHSAGA
ncbi:MAG: UMF1 family MFS transporter [Planctomycetota bacterium]|jgi:UMF1 family MFS transporter